MDDQDARTLVAELVAGQAGAWDVAGELPLDVVRGLAKTGLLCPDVPAEYGGLGWTSLRSGELTAFVGSQCSSLRSLMTSQGIAAWTIRRFGDQAQRTEHLRRLTSGELAAVAFSEPGAGSDLSAMETTISQDGGDAVVSGHKVWVTGAAYADTVVVFGRHGTGFAAVLVPVTAAGVEITRVPDPLGCRAAGHADVRLSGVRVPADRVLSAAGLPLEWLITSALTHGRLSVAWGCVGILRACLTETTRHATTRHQSGRPLAQHQLVARHLAELLAAEQSATRVCQHASRCWDEGSPEQVPAAVLAKHVAATGAARGSAAAVQVLASAGAQDGHPVARAYRDAKLMEIIEGSSEISQLLLAEQAVAVWS